MSGVDQPRVPQLNVIRTRVCQIELDGTPVVGSSSMYVSDALATAKLSPQYEAGDEIKEKNANGTVLLDYQAPPSLLRADLTMEFITTDPILMQILQSQGKALSGSFGIGWKYPNIGPQFGQCGLEFWTLRVNDGVLDPVHPYAHWVIPYVQNVQIGDRDFASASAKSVLSGQCFENQNWFDGPADDWPSAEEIADRIANWVTCDTIPAVSAAVEAVLAS